MVDHLGGAGNDSWTIAWAEGSSNVDGSGGTDSLIIDWSAGSVAQSASFSASGTNLVRGGGYLVRVANVEQLTLLSGSGDDSLMSNVVVAFDGGGGVDHFQGSFLYNYGIIFTLDETAGATSTFIGNGTTLRNVERVNLTTGNMNDSLTGGSLADELFAGRGYNLVNGRGGDYIVVSIGVDTVDGGDGADTWYADYSMLAGPLTVTESGGLYTLSNGTNARNMEKVYLRATGGNDSFQVSAPGYYFGGAGWDALTIDRSDFTRQQIGLWQSGERLAVYTAGDNVAVVGEEVEAVTVTFGSANDVFRLTGANVVSWDGGGGLDILEADFSSYNVGIQFTLDQSVGSTSTVIGNGTTIRNVEAIGIKGGTAGDVLTGGSLDENLDGFTGDDVLDGGGGGDRLYGGAGIDTLSFATVRARVIFSLATDQNREISSALVRYASGFENLLGSAGHDMLAGDSMANRIDGGLGADSMAGGGGDDIYHVDDSGDIVVEAKGEGEDSIHASASYSLVGRYVETLILTGAQDIAATGNALSNRLVGNAGDNILDGAGGTDSMAGGLGDDLYIVDREGDAVMERPGEGSDEVRTGLETYMLAAEVEALTGTSGSGQALTGNALDNRVAGSIGDDVIDGGLGADSMAGGWGDDIYHVDHVDDDVVEAGHRGDDMIFSSVGYTLVGRHVETLVLTGEDDVDAFGNALANRLVGNGGDNRMSGGGGTDLLDGGRGADRLTGGAGADIFRFSASIEFGEIDEITDFNVADDMIALSAGVFGAAGSVGMLSADALVIGAAAVDGDDRIIYNASVGMLYYDADGSGAGEAIAFARLVAGLALTAADFAII